VVSCPEPWIDDDDRVGKLALQHHVVRILDEMRRVHELVREQGQAPVVALERELPESKVILRDMECFHDGDYAFFAPVSCLLAW